LNQPASGAWPSGKLAYRKMPENRKIQYDSAFTRGKAMSREPRISGHR
jgi:hypothetical protein